MVITDHLGPPIQSYIKDVQPIITDLTKNRKGRFIPSTIATKTYMPSKIIVPEKEQPASFQGLPEQTKKIQIQKYQEKTPLEPFVIPIKNNDSTIESIDQFIPKPMPIARYHYDIPYKDESILPISYTSIKNNYLTNNYFGSIRKHHSLSRGSLRSEEKMYYYDTIPIEIDSPTPPFPTKNNDSTIESIDQLIPRPMPIPRYHYDIPSEDETSSLSSYVPIKNGFPSILMFSDATYHQDSLSRNETYSAGPYIPLKNKILSCLYRKSTIPIYHQGSPSAVKIYSPSKYFPTKNGALRAIRFVPSTMPQYHQDSSSADKTHSPSILVPTKNGAPSVDVILFSKRMPLFHFDTPKSDETYSPSLFVPTKND